MNKKEHLESIKGVKYYWRKKITKVIEFEDNQQDFLRWYLDDNGRVIFCAPFQGKVWQDCIVLKMKEGEMPTIDLKSYSIEGEEPRILNHRIIKITKLK